MTTTWVPGKVMVEGCGGIVAAQHAEAARAGAAVLARGGNAMDAAITTALTLSVVEPWLSGIGGGGFLVWRDAAGQTETLDFAMVSPRGITAEDYPLVPGKDGDWFDWPTVAGNRNLIGVHSVCVPGAIAGFAAALARHGSLSWAEALAPAIEAADRGLQIDWFANLCLSIDAQNLSTDAVSAATFLQNGRAPAISHAGPAQRLPLTQKAATLRRLAEAGPEDFYTGQIARQLIEDMAALGGKMVAADLAGYRPRWSAPLSKAWAGATIHAVPGLSGGLALLEALDGIGEQRFAGPAPGPEFFARAADAIRAAYARRLTHVGHAGTGGDSPVDPGCTTHLSVVDAAGNTVSLTNTLLSRFGSKVTSAQTGILLNNGMMWFDPRPGQPNSIAPGVRPLANMCPVIAEMPGGGTLAIGAAGGRQIMPAVAQLLAMRLLGGMDLGQAFAHPRIDASGLRIAVDRRLPAATAGQIARHHDVDVVDDQLYPVQFALPSAVERHADGRLQGMVHPNHPWSAAIAAESVTP